MDYRIFGVDSPSDEFIRQLRGFCSLDDVQREALAVWFESTSDFDTYPPKLPQSILASTLLPDQFREAVEPIRYILNAWQEYSLEVADIQRDLLLCGFEPEQIELVTKFLERISSARKRIWIDVLLRRDQVVGLPTIDDVHILWDARAIFPGDNYYYESRDADHDTYKQCVGLRCMAILELLVSDIMGSKERLAVQMNENTFRRLLRAMNRADEQLTSLNALIGPMTVDSRNPRG